MSSAVQAKGVGRWWGTVSKEKSEEEINHCLSNHRDSPSILSADVSAEEGALKHLFRIVPRLQISFITSADSSLDALRSLSYRSNKV